MFSKTCEYAIRAVIYIAAESAQGKITGMAELCKCVEVPEPYTAKILQTLTRKQLVSSKKGLNGGFFMDKSQSGKKLIDIVLAIDGDSLFEGCGLGLKQCSDSAPCPLHFKFKRIRSNLKMVMEKTSIAQMAGELKKGAVFSRPDNKL
jgi:Rrf2 family iron-sulfur cluster assembly transcriptional regulator